MRRLTLTLALFLAVLVSVPAAAQVNGIAVNASKGAVLLGSPAGVANCKAATTGAIRYNSVSNIPEYCNGSAWFPFDYCTSVQGYESPNYAGGAFPVQSMWGDGTYLYSGAQYGGLSGTTTMEALSYNNGTHTWTDLAHATIANGTNNIWGDGTYIYFSEGTSGIQAFTFNGTTLTLKGTYNTTMTSDWVFGQGGVIFVADDTHGLRAFTFNGTTFTLKATAAPASIVATYVWGDGTYIYSVDTGNDVVRAYTFAGTTFTLKATLASPGYGNWAQVWGDGTYVYVVGANGYGFITAYTFNGTTFTQKGIIGTDTGSNSYIWGGNNGNIYVTDGSYVQAYGFNGSTFIYKGVLPVSNQLTGLWVDSNNVYWANGYDASAEAYPVCH